MSLSEFIIGERERQNRILFKVLQMGFLGSLLFHGGLLCLTLSPNRSLQSDLTSNLTEDWTETEIVTEPAPTPLPSVANPVEPKVVEPEVADVAVLPSLGAAPPAAASTSPVSPQSEPPLSVPAPTPTTAVPPAPLLTDYKGEPVMSVAPALGQPWRQLTNLLEGFDRGLLKPSATHSGSSGTTGTGVPGGVPSGVPSGVPGRVPGGDNLGSPANPAPETPKPPQRLVCVHCPKPNYQGTQGSAKVLFDVDDQGNVVNLRLQESSGNSKIDQATLEAVNQWKFSPSGEGQRRVRRRVTFEEEGSDYQQQNEERRRQSQPRQPVEPEPRRPEPDRPTPQPSAESTPVAKPRVEPESTTPASSAGSVPVASPPAPVPAPVVEPAPPTASEPPQVKEPEPLPVAEPKEPEPSSVVEPKTSEPTAAPITKP